jgi:uncharacterized protein
MFYRWDGNNLILECTIQPKSKESSLVGVKNDVLKIRLTAPPTDGKANKQLIKFLAKQFQVKQSAITIVNGQTSRLKRLCIEQPKALPEILAIDKKQ